MNYGHFSMILDGNLSKIHYIYNPGLFKSDAEY